MITLPSLAALTTAALSPATAAAPATRHSPIDLARSSRLPTRLPEPPGEPARTVPRGSLLDLSV